MMCNAMGEFDVENFEEKIDRGTRLVSVVLSSNITGTRAL